METKNSSYLYMEDGEIKTTVNLQEGLTDDMVIPVVDCGIFSD